MVKRLADGCGDTGGFGSFTPAIYDTAWLSMVTKSVNGEQKLLFPECLSYILREQLEDGGWSSYSSPVNGILNSLASLLSLLKHSNANHRFDIEPTSLKVRIDKAKTALSVALGNWDVKSTVHVGFEILVPSFLEQLEDYGVFFEFPGKGDLAILNEENLARFPKMLIYANMQTTLLHSLEAFIGKIDFDRVGHQLRNGSMFGSPASTAAYLMHSSTWDNEAEAYLRTVYNRAASSGGIPSAFPSTVFESSWVRTSQESAKSNWILLTEILGLVSFTYQRLPYG